MRGMVSAFWQRNEMSERVHKAFYRMLNETASQGLDHRFGHDE
jgi:hypothetical protein